MTVLPAPTTTHSADDEAQIAFANSHRRCMHMSFWPPCFPSQTTSSSSWWQNLQSAAPKEPWWCRRWKAAREWSEAENWKALVQRFIRFNKNKTKRHCSFRYDPLSYALNFDDGTNAGEQPHGYAAFSARFASVPFSREDHVPPPSKIQR